MVQFENSPDRSALSHPEQIVERIDKSVEFDPELIKAEFEKQKKAGKKVDDFAQLFKSAREADDNFKMNFFDLLSVKSAEASTDEMVTEKGERFVRATSEDEVPFSKEEELAARRKDVQPALSESVKIEAETGETSEETAELQAKTDEMIEISAEMEEEENKLQEKSAHRWARWSKQSGLTSYWAMEKIWPAAADGSALLFLDDIYQDKSPEVKADAELAFKTVFEVYHQYDKRKDGDALQNRTINAAQNMVDIYYDPSRLDSLNKADKQALKDVGAFGVDWFYALKAKAGSPEKLKEILTHLQELSSNSGGDKNEFMVKLTALFKPDSLSRFSGIIYKYLFPDERDKGLFEGIFDKAKGLIDLGVTVFNPSKLKKKAEEYLKTKLNQTTDLPNLLKVLWKMRNADAGSIDALIELTDYIHPDDLKVILNAYLDSLETATDPVSSFTEQAIAEGLVKMA